MGISCLPHLYPPYIVWGIIVNKKESGFLINLRIGGGFVADWNDERIDIYNNNNDFSSFLGDYVPVHFSSSIALCTYFK